MAQNENQSELLILAHRYLSDELSPVEADEFELRLAADGMLQSALTDVVMIQESLRLLSPSAETLPTVTSSGRRTYGRFGGVVAVLTASVAVAVLLFAGPWFSSVTRSVNETQGIASDSVDRRDLEAIGLWTMMADEPELAEAEESHTNGMALAEIDVPDWMFAAVEASLVVEEMEMMDANEAGGTL